MAKEAEKTPTRNDEPKAVAKATVEQQTAEDPQNPSHLQPYPDGSPQDPYAAKTIAHPKAMEDDEPPPPPPPPESTRKAPEPEAEAKREKK